MIDRRLIAIHEAAHFVMHQFYGLGPAEKLTIERDGIRDGYYEPQGTLYAAFLQREREGGKIETMRLQPGASLEKFQSAVKTFRFQRREYIYRSVTVDLAGGAAEAELCGGSGMLSLGDAQAANANVRMLFDREGGNRFCAARMRIARELCAGELKAPIMKTADVLLEKNDAGPRRAGRLVG